MRCQWQAYLNLVPPWMRSQVDELGRDKLQELRLRLDQPPELILKGDRQSLGGKVSKEDLHFVVNIASRYSPWAAQTVSEGFITARGGHRVGLCGEATVAGDNMTGISIPTSLCLRVARDFPDLAIHAAEIQGSILVIGRPGSGKTTLLRDLVRQRSQRGPGSVAVVDERRELFPSSPEGFSFPQGPRTDVLSGCKKPAGIEAVLRNMGPQTIAVDEITAEADCNALIHAGWCGVELLATAHAGDMHDLLSRPVYGPIIKSKLFQTVIVLRRDQSWYAERMETWN